MPCVHIFTLEERPQTLLSTYVSCNTKYKESWKMHTVLTQFCGTLVSVKGLRPQDCMARGHLRVPYWQQVKSVGECAN